MPNSDKENSEAFASSWNNLPLGSVYTEEQVRDWFKPISPDYFRGKTILELGCGNGSLMIHVLNWLPRFIKGIDLGSSVKSAYMNMQNSNFNNWQIEQADLTTYRSDGYDLVYCIGVLHHLNDPYKGFESMIANTKKGGMFHGWVYAFEGNALVRILVEPIRRFTSRLPWWLTKYLFANFLAVPFYLYGKFLYFMPRRKFFKKFPLYRYCLWIAKRNFLFFRHVVFDQLVSLKTSYIKKDTIQKWLSQNSFIDPKSVYIEMRNGNSWKFGGKLKA